MPPGAPQDAVREVVGQQVIRGPRRPVQVVLPREGQARPREGRDHQPVPRSENLGVGERRRPPGARLVQLRPDALEEGPRLRVRDLRQREHVLALEVAGLRGVEEQRRPDAVLVAEDLAKLLRGPDEEGPLFALAVGVGRRVERARGVGHLPRDRVQHLAGDGPVERVLRRLPALDVRHREQRVVVEHLLEVRHQPLRVGGIAVEAAAHLIVDAAQRHFGQRVLRHPQRLRVAGALPAAQEEAEVEAGRKLGRPPHAALVRIEDLRVVAQRVVEDGFVGQPGGAVGGKALPHRLRDLLGGLLRPPALLAVDPVQLDQHAAKAEARAALAVVRGKVGAAEEGLGLGREEDAHGPAAVLGEHLHGLHVDGVHVGPLLAVDLDGHELLVEDARDLRVLERLLLHHVAPVAGGVADAEEHRPPQRARFGKGLVAPRPPVHRVVGVLQEVRRGLERQPVGEARRAVVAQVAGAEGRSLRDRVLELRAQLL